MQQAATHLPADAERPALILFTDGKHDVKGVPASRVQPTRDQLFGTRTPFALLPVGMGLDPKERGALTAGLDRLKIVKDMPACTSGATFDWPTVSFNSAGRGGQRGRGRAAGRDLHLHRRPDADPADADLRHRPRPRPRASRSCPATARST